jgi:hypothetical protein
LFGIEQRVYGEVLGAERQKPLGDFVAEQLALSGVNAVRFLGGFCWSAYVEC